MQIFVLCGALLIGSSVVLGDTCTRCRAFDLTLGCVSVDNNVKPVYNGYMCAALAGQNVDLNCTLGDSEDYELSYEWYKSSKIGGTPFSASDSATKISNCTSSICTIYDVQWGEDSSDVTAHDSFFYQCVVSVKDNDTSVATFYSNALALDVQYYAPPTTAATTTHTVDIGTVESKLSCSVPSTNPASSVVWYYSQNSSTNGTALGNVDNMLVVQDNILSTDAKFGYSKGMLVIMKFTASNAGTYTCAVKYTNMFGTTQQKDTSTHTVSSSGVTLSSVSEELRVVSQVSSPSFLFKDTDETVLHCLGSNLVAGETAFHYWQKAETVNGIEMYRNLTGSGWYLSNENRTLTLDRSNALEGAKYRCQIQKGTDSILVNGYTQAPIIPKSGFIPTGGSCSTGDSTVTVTADDLMTSDVTSTGVVQVLAGSSYYWKKDNTDITMFSDGYSVSSTSMELSASSNQQCHYMQQFKYYDQLYSVQQIHTLSVLDDSYTTIPTVTMESSGGDTVTVTCTASVDAYPSNLQDKVGLHVLFDVGGCLDYAEALQDESANSGTCGTSNTRWLKINTLKLCSDCVVRCAASTSCKASSEESVTIAANLTVSDDSCTVCGKSGKVGLSCENGTTEISVCSLASGDAFKIQETGGESCDGSTDAVTSDELPGWGVALIVVAVIIGLLGISAVFFYSYMQKLQDDSDGKIMGAAVLKVNAEDDKMKKSKWYKRKKNTSTETQPSPIITMPTFTSGFGSFFNAEPNPEEENKKKKKGKSKQQQPPAEV